MVGHFILDQKAGNKPAKVWFPSTSSPVRSFVLLDGLEGFLGESSSSRIAGRRGYTLEPRHELVAEDEVAHLARLGCGAQAVERKGGNAKQHEVGALQELAEV